MSSSSPSVLSDVEWVEMWVVCVTTQLPEEEKWAFRKLKAAYIRVTGEVPIDPKHDLPTGMWEAMEETAQRVRCQPAG